MASNHVRAMAILKSCCCSIRQGSFVSGIYTAVLYAVKITLIVVNYDITELIKGYPWLGYWVLILPSLVVVTSVILLVGICVRSSSEQITIPIRSDNHKLPVDLDMFCNVEQSSVAGVCLQVDAAECRVGQGNLLWRSIWG
ncbi:hypothetical protein GQR58_000998 [Nymphon striatum]|nr:hypothetical protein GQR58_000998 [Nymphon striatum]